VPIAQGDVVDIYYERHGDPAGEPLLLIMGMSGTHLTWGDRFLGGLTGGGGLAVIAYDHRGVGQSTRLRGEITTEEMAGDAAALLDALELESAHVMGISLGGMVAQKLALHHPERVRTLVLGCTYCGGPGSRMTDDSVVARLNEGLQSGDRELAIRTTWEVNVSSNTVLDPEAFATFRERVLELPVSFPVILAQIRAINAHDTSAELGGLAPPTLIVHGTADEMLPVDNAHVMARYLPVARLALLDGIGHMFWWERPAEAAELVREHALGKRSVALSG
jgi:pimeloyl-ACP methyl ester carboxylesterase